MHGKHFVQDLILELRLNQGLRVKVFIALFRLAHLADHHDRTRVFAIASAILFKVMAAASKIDLSHRTRIGWGLRIFHPFCICIHPDVVIGRNCLLRHGVTLGNTGIDSTQVPIIEDDVEFGCYAVVVGPAVVKTGTKVRALSLTVGDRTLARNA